jgi:hypothetical protein
MNLRRTQPGRTPPVLGQAGVLPVRAAAQFTDMLATSIVNVALPQIRTALEGSLRARLVALSLRSTK